MKEEILHYRYLTLYNRSISFPAIGDKPVRLSAAGRPAHLVIQALTFSLIPSVLQAVTHEYDIVGHPQCEFHFTVVFPYHAPSEGQLEGHVRTLSA